ncbi:hypothetical protein C8J56DRAFT_933460 [Mycena floridula]|nr:hypothetical protein C8J56DRAFT_933460 [Mycena floridula]
MEICFQRHLRRAYPCFSFLLIFLLFPRLLLFVGKHGIAPLNRLIDILLFYVRSFLIREALTYGALNCSSIFVSRVYIMVT